MPKSLRCLLLNAENLFVLMDEEPQQSFESMTEKAWQRLSISTTQNKPLGKTMELAVSLNEIDPDLIMFVEVGGKESLENFNKYFLKDRYEVFLIEGNSDRAIDVGFLVKKGIGLYCRIESNKNHPLKFLYEHEKMSLASGYKGLVRRKGAKFSRDVAELYISRVSKDVKKAEALFLLTHLKSKREGFQFDPQGGEKRRAEVEALIEIYKKRFKETGGEIPIFVCGDLNGNASRNETEDNFEVIYSQTELEDLFELFQLPQEERITYHHIRGGIRSDQQLDYVFLAKKFKDRIPSEPYIYEYKFPTGEKRPSPLNIREKLDFPSDHYPYVFEFQLAED